MSLCMYQYTDFLEQHVAWANTDTEKRQKSDFILSRDRKNERHFQVFFSLSSLRLSLVLFLSLSEVFVLSQRLLPEVKWIRTQDRLLCRCLIQGRKAVPSQTVFFISMILAERSRDVYTPTSTRSKRSSFLLSGTASFLLTQAERNRHCLVLLKHPRCCERLFRKERTKERSTFLSCVISLLFIKQE